MSEIETQTPPQDPGATGGENNTPPAATNPQGGGGATDDNTVTLSQEDYKNLVGQRDRANNANSETDLIVNDLLKKDAVKDFLQEHKDEFPDVTIDDLMAANDPEELESIAKNQQKRIEDAVQKKLMDVQKATPPAISPEQKAERMKQLREKPDGGSFQEMLTLEQG